MQRRELIEGLIAFSASAIATQPGGKMFDKLKQLLGGGQAGAAAPEGPPAIAPIHIAESDLDDGDLPLDEPDRSLDVSMHYLDALTNAHNATWRLGTARWDADLDAGTLTFTNDRGWKIVAPVQVIGTLNTADGTWLWGWDHPSVPEPLRAHAALVRDFGAAHGLEAFTTRHIEASEEDGWQFAALAAYLAKAQGAYRGPSGQTMIFMTFGELTISQA